MRVLTNLICAVALFSLTTAAPFTCLAETTESDKLSAEGFKLLEEGNLQEAEEALKKAQKDLEAGHPKYNDIEFALSDIHEREGNVLKAITEFEWALLYYEGLEGLTSPKVADKLDHLTLMLRKAGLNNRAEIAELEAKQVREKKLPFAASGIVAMAKDGTISLILGPEVYEYKPSQKYYQGILKHVKPLYPETDRWLLPGNMPGDWPELRNADAGPLRFTEVRTDEKLKSGRK